MFKRWKLIGMNVTYTNGRVERFRCFNNNHNREGLLKIIDTVNSAMLENLPGVITFNKSKINIKHVAAVKFRL